MPEFDIVLKDGIVVDGTQSQRYRADVGIARGRIARIGRLRGSDATRVLDASGHDRRARASSTCTRTTTRSCSGIRT